MRLILFFALMLSFTSKGQDNISLISPYDGDTIETKNPLLTWTYMNGIQQNGREYYRIIVVELKKKQSAEAGIIVNQPLIKMDQVPGTQLFYPFDAPELKEGHRYGWQIQKMTNNVIIDKSEAWEFILRLPEDPEPQYFKMKFKDDGTYQTVVNGKLYFQFNENYKESELKYFVYDSANKLVDVTLQNNSLEQDGFDKVGLKKTGSNFYELNLGNALKLGNYKLVVMDAKGQKYLLNFLVK